MMRKLCVIAVLMFGFGYALVPLYRAICDALGINVLSIAERATQARGRRSRATPRWTRPGR
jgi:cytochrome c oxidase assembly protein subunit 11